ncbi:MAG TPA: amino acid ABC transporter ATP-binding protein [Ramlibacter sp.]|nr:amino acid ABC transporter ATP-binding protein [Ramlibacter sp.]
MHDPDLMIDIRGVSRRFGSFTALNNVSAQVRRGEVIVICGPSGSGKSTLVRTLNRLETIDEGSILIDGQDVWANGASPEGLRTRVGMVFQSFNLFPHLDARDNVAIGLHRVLKVPRQQAREKAAKLLESVGLSRCAGHFPAQLSGGQQQRVAICRAIAMGPSVLLFDEPTSALDPEMVGEVLALMKSLAGSGVTMLCVTHEMGFAREVADTIWFMDEGQLLERRTAAEFFGGAQHPRARQFLSRILRASPDDVARSPALA